MADEMTVQAQKPSTLPYVAGGAIVGGAGAGALAHYANFGYKTQCYKSWEDAIKDTNDEFIKSQAEKDGDSKTAFQTLKEQREAVKTKQTALDNIAKEFSNDKDKETVKTYIDKEKELSAKQEEVLNEIKKDITDGKIENVSQDLKDTALENKAKELLEKETKYKNKLNEAQTAFDSAKTEFDKLTGETKTKFVNAFNELKNAEKTAKEALTDNILSNIKRAKLGWHALGGALICAGIGWLLAPKGNSEV